MTLNSESTSRPARRDIIDVYALTPYITRWSDHILAAVAKEFEVTPHEMTGCRRFRRVVRARWAAAYFLQKYRGYSTPQLGKIFKRDHSTIVHGLGEVRQLLKRDVGFSVQMYRVEAELLREAA